jgi:hypothetical protein
MRTAVLFTGQERTLPRTIKLLRRNLLEPNNTTVFLACESMDSDSLKGRFDGLEIGGTDIRSTFRDPEFTAFINVVWCSGRRGLLRGVFERSQEGYTIDYVFTSGTLLQYYQIWKAWMLLLEYETTHKVKFDVVVRCRPDALITEKLNLSSVLSSDELTCRSFGSERIRRLITPTGDPTEKAVLTLGAEQIWIARRDVFALLGPMLLFYGYWDSGSKYAFNSESFFEQFCKMNHLVYWPLFDGTLFNLNHPGSEEVLDDPQVFSLLR